MTKFSQQDFKPSYIAWYEIDFRADRVVQRMSFTQKSFYRNLLMESYFGGHRPYLTADDNELWLIADAANLNEWMTNKDLILTKFTTVELENGERLLSNKRVSEEWKRLEELLKAKKNAGLASAEARRKKAKKTPRAEEKKVDHSRVEEIRVEESRVDKSVEVCSTPVQVCSTPVQPIENTRDTDTHISSDSVKSQKTPKIKKSRKRDLADFVVAIAAQEKSGVVFSPEDVTSIRQTLSKHDVTEKQLEDIVREEVSAMLPKNIPFAGRNLSASLPGKLLGIQIKTEKRQADDDFARKMAEAPDTTNWFSKTKPVDKDFERRTVGAI